MVEKLGTFQTNRNNKIHSWYPYLAGFSAELVQQKINEYKLNQNHKIFDPFAGVGTTLLVAQENNIKSAGVEINPFVSFVANTKLQQNYSKKEIQEEYDNLVFQIELYSYKKFQNKVPSLLERAFSEKILNKLIYLKNLINSISDEKIKNLFLLCLISILKEVSNCKNFSPYLEFKEDSLEDANVFEIFKFKLLKFIDEIKFSENFTNAIVYEGTAKNLSFINDKFDFILTSPPYLNNWDYSWITKIELFFLGYANSEKEITTKLRNNLMKSSTYVLQNVDKNNKFLIPESPVKNEILDLIKKINFERTNRSNNSKKYDLVVREYFNDVYIIFKELNKILNKGAHCLWVVGDSALYGVHIKTDILCGKIAELAGFEFEGIEILRKRRASRHNIDLQESIIKLKKQ